MGDGRDDRVCRLRLVIGGRVQGVGFRPFVYRVAVSEGLTGLIRNTASGVEVEVQGEAGRVEAFRVRVMSEGPGVASPRVGEVEELPVVGGERGFEIAGSSGGSSAASEVTPDLAVCGACLAEMRDAADRRRHGYVLSNCTYCGPRYSILRAVPYDRCNTTLAGFVLCEACGREYGDPGDRRFHAQPTACRECGPRVRLEGLGAGVGRVGGDPVAEAAEMLRAGKIVAVKGLGGFHLACLAGSAEAVVRLRRLKHRPRKPLAVMVGSVEAARGLVHLSGEGEKVLVSARAPILIAQMRENVTGRVAAEVAPGTRRLGVMLGYTPMHHRLFDLLGEVSLVMTSANDDGAPMVYDDADAGERLAGLCDAVLTHDRAIHRPVDDSVVLDGRGGLVMIRRARGYVPSPIELPVEIGSGAAYGGELKNTVAVVREMGGRGEVIVSQHLGDLSNLEAYRQFMRAERDLLELFRVRPEFLACDLHPGYGSTRYAVSRSKQLGVPLYRVQHHHAHAVAVMAEHGCTGPAVGVVLDGTGYAPADESGRSAIWGGEVLRCTLTGYSRFEHLSYFPLPGGDQAAREPWRSGLALLRVALGGGFAGHAVTRRLVGTGRDAEIVLEMVASGRATVPTSSTGRLFDGVAAMLGVATENTYEAEAPAALETLAESVGEKVEPWETRGLEVGSLVRAVLGDMEAGVPVAMIAARFHCTLAQRLAESARRAAEGYSDTVVLGGGAMCNDLLASRLEAVLREGGLRVLRPAELPANDGGLCFGQAVVAGMLHRARSADAG